MFMLSVYVNIKILNMHNCVAYSAGSRQKWDRSLKVQSYLLHLGMRSVPLKPFQANILENKKGNHNKLLA